MFLGGLSTTTERKARKESGSQKSKVDSSSSSVFRMNAVEAALPGATTPSGVPRRLRKGVLPVIYSATNPDIPREVMLRYFIETSRMILDETNMVEMIEEASRGVKGLETVAAEFQREILEYNFQIERNYGCRHMSALPDVAAGDTELLNAGVDFVRTCQRAYVELLRLRRRRTGDDLRTTGPMPRTSICEFFEGCNALMGLPETKAELKTIYETTGQPGNQRVVEMQKGIIELLGLDAEYGISFLNRMAEDYPQDEDLHVKMNQFALCAQLSVRESMMSEAEKTAFYEDIPLFLRPFPHIYVFHQQMLQMKAQRQAGPMAQVQALMGNEEVKARIMNLTSRMEVSKSRVEADIAEWSSTRKREYVMGFQDNSTLAELTTLQSDPMARLNKVLDFTDGELDSFMTIMAVIASDIKANGSMLRELMQDAGPKAKSMIASIQQMQSFMQAGNRAAAAAAGSGGHVHGPDCNHSASEIRAPDVTTGIAARMDR